MAELPYPPAYGAPDAMAPPGMKVPLAGVPQGPMVPQQMQMGMMMGAAPQQGGLAGLGADNVV
jgi:hypothetical protein